MRYYWQSRTVNLLFDAEIGASSTLIYPHLNMSPIDSLPFELLSYILQTTYDLALNSSKRKSSLQCSGFTEGNRQAAEFALTISHCSNRFRDIALQTPRLWSLVHNGWHILQFEEFIRRSKGVGLSIIADCSKPKIKLPELLGIILPHQERLILLHLDLSASPLTIMELVDTLTRCPSLVFSSLNELIVIMKVIPIEITDRVSHLFSRWSLPKLQVLRTYNFLPTFVVGGLLTQFFFEYNHDVEDAAALDLISIHTLMERSPQLQHLSLYLRCDESHYYVYEAAIEAGPFYVEKDYPPVFLPNLTKLSVSVQHPKPYQYNPPPSLLQSLIMPNLHRLELTLCGSLIEPWFEAFSFYNATTVQFDCTSLLTLILRFSDHEVDAQYLFDTISDLPKLRRLLILVVEETVNVTGRPEERALLNLEFVQDFPSLPALRELTLSSCGRAPRRFATAFVRRYKELWDDGTFVFNLYSESHRDELLSHRLTDVLGDRFNYDCREYDGTLSDVDILTR